MKHTELFFAWPFTYIEKKNEYEQHSMLIFKDPKSAVTAQPKLFKDEVHNLFL